MVLFEAQHIYGVEDGDVCVRTGAIQPYEAHIMDSSAEVWRDITVQGVQKTDFGMFVDVIDDEGIMSEVPYLVTHYMGDSSIIVPADLVEFDHQQYATAELARKLQSVNYEEMAQFGLDALLKELTRRYPLKRS